MSKRRKSKRRYILIRLNIKLAAVVLTALMIPAALGIFVKAVERDSLDIPIVMYHSLLKDPDRQGEYVVSPATFEADLKYLQEQGYETILVKDLIAYTNGGTLPDKPIMLTFDDGYFNNYSYGFDIAKKYNCKFVIFPIGIEADKYTDSYEENANYSHANWDRLKEMQDSGMVEVQSHSYDLHSISSGRWGAKKKKNETSSAYRAAIIADIQHSIDAIQEHIGRAPTAFAYPFGGMSQETPDILKDLGFSATMTSNERISSITRDPESLHGLGRFVRPSGQTSESFFKNVMKLN